MLCNITHYLWWYNFISFFDDNALISPCNITIYDVYLESSLMITWNFASNLWYFKTFLNNTPISPYCAILISLMFTWSHLWWSFWISLINLDIRDLFKWCPYFTMFTFYNDAPISSCFAILISLMSTWSHLWWSFGISLLNLDIEDLL